MRLPLYRQTRAYLQDTCPAYSEPSNDPFLIENSEIENKLGSGSGVRTIKNLNF